MDARGRPFMQRRGVRRSGLAHDAYHFLRTTSWTAIMAIFAGGFVLANLLFAAAYDVTGATVTNAHGFLDYLWFSVQTMATIGYGYRPITSRTRWSRSRASSGSRTPH